MIREAQKQDLPVMISMGYDMQMESDYSGLDYDPSKLFDLGYSMVFGGRRSVNAWVYIKDDEIVGMMVGTCVPHFFGSDKVATELLLYIDPEHRGGLAAARMIKSFVRWAQAQDAKEILVGSSTGIHPRKTGAIYKALGFSEVGPILKKRF